MVPDMSNYLTIRQRAVAHAREVEKAQASKKRLQQTEERCAKHPSARIVEFESGHRECWTCMHIDGKGEL